MSRLKFKVTVFLIFITAVLLFAPVYSRSFPDTAYVISEQTDLYAFNVPNAVKTQALSAILIDADSGRVLYAKNENVMLPMASTTKIMTAVIILETLDLDTKIKVGKESVGVEGSSIYLMEGETLTVKDLLYGLMLQSGNDAANALAVACAGSVENFAKMMNRKASELGLKRTNFQNPSGLPAQNHRTTAFDLAALTSYAIKNEEFVKITSTLRATISDGKRYLVNRNNLLRHYEGLIGVKTGYTSAAGRCLVTAARRNGVTLIAVMLNSRNIWNDHTVMLDYGFDYLESVTPVASGQIETRLPVTGGQVSSIKAVNREDFTCSLPEGAVIDIEVSSQKILYPPIKAGDVVGEVKIFANGIMVGKVPLVSTESVRAKKLNFFERFLK